MVEFVFAWTVKELVKTGLSIFFGILLMLFVISGLHSLDANEKNSNLEDSFELFKWGAVIAAIAEVGILLFAYIARYFYWVIAIW